MPPPLITPESMVGQPRHDRPGPPGEGSWGTHRPSVSPVQAQRPLTSFDPLTVVEQTSLDYLSRSESGHSIEAGGLVVPTPPMPTVPMGFNDPTNANMDHLFNWLFSMTNIENVSTLPQTPVAGAVDATQLDVPPPPRTEQAGHLVPGFTQRATEAETQPAHENHSWASPTQHARGPPFPAFPETWDESGWRLPPPKDLIDEQARSDMRDLFDGPERDYFSTPAFSLPQMKLYLELYFL